MMRNDHPITFGKTTDARPQCNNITHQLVAKYGANTRTVGIELEQIGAAKTHHTQAEKNFALTRYRCWSFFQDRLIAAKTGNHPMAGLAALAGSVRLYKRNHVT